MSEHGGHSDSQDLALLLMAGLAVAGGWKLWQARLGPAVSSWLDQHGPSGLSGAGGAAGGFAVTDLVFLCAGSILLLLIVGSIRRRRAQARRDAEHER